MDNSNGFITVTVNTATGSYPVGGAEVIVSVIENGTDNVIHRFITDESGMIPKTALSAPDASNSLSSTSQGEDYRLYNVTVNGDGFYPLVSLNVPIFSGVTATQIMTLIPYTASSEAGMEGYVPECAPYPGGCGPVSEKGGPDD